ncbi:uncharacterized protein PFLUO_LOCUS5990 [Penicillium psychrofluorescens]|uniref:uncharacterized protein n=1 Tax=Penicillium psychrofluorescens TaxID=3158075 RepID=UPI003CCC9135
MPSIAEHSCSSQEALLRLEKANTAPPSTQLNDAAKVLGLDLALCESHPEAPRSPTTTNVSTPKEEWVLRWLLKRLKSGKNYRVEPASFLLLRQLVDLISPKNLAAILKDHKFLSILGDTVADLEADVFANVEHGLNSEAGHTLAGSPPGNEANGTKIKKRKRVSFANNAGGRPQDSAQCFLTFIRALDCLFGVVMLAHQTLRTDEVAHSHLKLALRGEPEEAALFLGRSFWVASGTAKHFSQAGKTTDLQHMLYVLPAALELWDFRSYRQDDTENKSSNECFAKYCFAHALRLQLCLRSLKLDTDERALLLHAVERTVVLHVLLPARGAFFERGGSGIDYSTQDKPNWEVVQPVTDSFKSIIRETPLTDLASEKANQKDSKRASKSLELLPELLDIASRAVPRDSFRSQTHEAPWLETLFVAVAEIAYSTSKREKDTATFSGFSRKFVVSLQQIMQVAVDRNIGLSLNTTLNHSWYTGILQPGLQHVQWNVTALIVRLGVDIFLPSSGFYDSCDILVNLLDKILLHWRDGGSKDLAAYPIIKNDIVLPLLRAFVEARDLYTFTSFWHHQTILVEMARAKDSSLTHFSVWEDDDLSELYSELVRTAPADPRLVAHMRAASKDTRAADGKLSDAPASYAKFIVLEASFRRRAFSFPDSEASLSYLLETVTSTLSSKQALHWRWRLWRFVRNLAENDRQSMNTAQRQSVLALVDIAAKTMKRNHRELTQRASVLEAWEAYQFVLVATRGPDQLGAFNTATQHVMELINSVLPADAKKSMASPWNGRADAMDSPINLALAYFSAISKIPQVWKRISADARSQLLKQLLSLAAEQCTSSPLPLENAADDARFLQGWASIVSHEYLLRATFLVPDLVTLLKDSIYRDPTNHRLYFDSLQRIPASLITRGMRGILLDKLHDVLILQNRSSELTVGLITILAKLAEEPKSDAVLTSHIEPICAAARAIVLNGTDLDLQIMKAFRSLHRAVISKLLNLPDGQKTKLFKEMFSQISTQASKMRQIERDSMACFHLRISLSQLWLYRKQLRSAFSEKDLATCRERVFGLVLADVKSVKNQCRKQKLEETVTLIKTIDSLEDFEDLAMNNLEVEKFLSKIESYVEMSVDSVPTRLIRRRLLASKEPDVSITEPVLQCAETLSLQSPYGEDQQLFIRVTTECFHSMGPKRIIEAIREVRELGLTGDHAGRRLLVVCLALASLPSVEDKDSIAARELSLVCTALAEAIPHSPSVDHLSYAVEALDLLLRTHTRCLVQQNIDSILSAIANAASHDGPHIASTYAPTIYTRLCRLMGVVLGLQRLKVGGRFHLVVHAMQRLLACLFARSRKRTRANRASPPNSLLQPFWLAPLQPSHASHYTRLLTSLCDPTMSAVLRPAQAGASRDALTDQTKKAKRIAGQYLQYVIMEYAQCSLRGALTPEVKAAIMPGLYATLDVMSRESMRALNAALDISGRAVFRSLYEDYVKFGKWDKA